MPLLGETTLRVPPLVDDGPLADPALFGGFWAAWRDEQGQPYATYSTSSGATQHFDESGQPVDPSASHVDSAATPGSGDKSWKQNQDQI